METLKHKFRLINGGKILDVGTGRGEFIYLLREYLNSFKEIIGIDSQEKAVNYCREHFTDPTIHFDVMDASHLDFPDNTFDTVCISNTLHHLPEQEKILHEMKRVLKPNGQFIINEMIRDHQTNEQLSHVKLHHFSAKLDCMKGIYHGNTYSKGEVMDIVHTLSLSHVDIFDYECEDHNPKDMESINYLMELCDDMIEKITDCKEFATYQKECEEIKEWIKKYGYEPATELVVIGQKEL